MEDTLGAEPQAAPKAVVWSRHSSGHRSRMLCELPETDERDLQHLVDTLAAINTL